MRLLLISSLTFLMLISTAVAERDRAQIEEHPCAEHTPYYHARPSTPGTWLADIFLFPGTLIIATAIGGGPRVEHYDRRTQRTRTVSTAWCMPASLLHHYRNRPVAEPRR